MAAIARGLTPGYVRCMTNRISHLGHNHPNTTAARTACRRSAARNLAVGDAITLTGKLRGVSALTERPKNAAGAGVVTEVRTLDLDDFAGVLVMVRWDNDVLTAHRIDSASDWNSISF